MTGTGEETPRAWKGAPEINAHSGGKSFSDQKTAHKTLDQLQGQEALSLESTGRLQGRG